MKRVAFAFLTSVLSLAARAEAPSFDWDWVMSASTTAHRDSLFFPSNQARDTQQIEALLDVEMRWHGWLGLVAIKQNALWSSDAQQHADSEFILQELFWQGSLVLADVPFELTLGKVRLDWGVGYGYRPLDLFQPYRRNPVGIQVEEGAGMLSASYYDQQGEWTFFYTDSSWTEQQGSELQQMTEQQGAGVRRYQLMGNAEWQAIAYYDDVRRGVLGSSFVTVLTDAWEVHASALYQRHYLAYQRPSALAQAVYSQQQEIESRMALESRTQGYQALVGFNWSGSDGQSVIAEYWFDSRSWGKEQWQQAQTNADSVRYQHNQALGWSYAQGYNQVNLVQHNVMLHASLDSQAWRHWAWSQSIEWLQGLVPTLDVLIAPQDGGVIVTQWLNYSVYDSGTASIEIELAARFMTGPADSTYANLPDKHMILLNMKGKF